MAKQSYLRPWLITKAGLTVLLTLCTIIFCSAPCLAADQITIAGTGDSQNLLRFLAGSYEAEHPDAIIKVPNSIGSGGGIRMTAHGKSDLGRVARPLKQKEKKFNLNYRLFSMSPVVFFANSNVESVENLTHADIVAIYSGRLTNWQALGGTDKSILVVNREPGDSSRSILSNKIPGFKDISKFAGKMIYSTPEAVEIITKYPFTIGYGPLAMAKDAQLKIFQVNNVYPDAAAIMSGKYGLVVPLGLVWKGELSGLAKSFINYISSPTGKKIMTKFGALPVNQTE